MKGLQGPARTHLQSCAKRAAGSVVGQMVFFLCQSTGQSHMLVPRLQVACPFARHVQVEHANPFLTMLLPAWLEQRHPAAAAALRGNEQKLLSAHDIHATLHHLLHLHQQPPGAPAPGREQLAAWAGTTGGVHRHVFWGSSLLAPLPANRTCEEAGVPPERCWCAFDRDFSRPT